MLPDDELRSMRRQRTQRFSEGCVLRTGLLLLWCDVHDGRLLLWRCEDGEEGSVRLRRGQPDGGASIDIADRLFDL